MYYNKYTDYSAEQIVTPSYQDLSTLFLDMAKLEEQNISDKGKDLISLIYYNYIADKNEEDKLIKLWNEITLKYAP